MLSLDCRIQDSLSHLQYRQVWGRNVSIRTLLWHASLNLLHSGALSSQLHSVALRLRLLTTQTPETALAVKNVPKLSVDQP